MKKGREERRLEEVCGFQNGYAFRSSTYKNSGLPIIRITNIQSELIHTNDLVYFDEMDYNEDFQKYKVYPNDLVIAMSGATTGKLGINKTDTIFYLNQRVGKFLPKKELLKDFLFYFLTTKVEENLLISAGAAQPNLSTEQIKNFKIPIPPLPDQHRIVSILDESFAAISTAKENAEKNLANTLEVFDTYLNSVFINPNNGWEEKRIEKIAKVLNGFSFDSSDFSPLNKLKSVKITNVGVKEFVEEKDNLLPENFGDIYSAFKVQEGNIVIALTRTIISGGLKVAVVPKIYDGALLNQRVAAIIPLSNVVHQRFLYYYLGTEIVANYVKSHVNTLMQPNLSITDLKNLNVPHPKSLSEQQSIIDHLDSLSSETKKLETIYKQKLADLEELKKSILEKAFNGELNTN